MRQSRRALLAALGGPLLTGCSSLPGGPNDGPTDGGSQPSGIEDGTANGPPRSVKTHSPPATFTIEFDLTRGRNMKATQITRLAYQSEGRLAYEATVESSSDEPTPVDFAVLPSGQLPHYLNPASGYSRVTEACEGDTMEASVEATLSPGEYVFVADNSDSGASSPNSPLGADRVVATVEFDLST